MKDILQPLINEFMPFAQKRMGFEKPPRVFLRDDPQNAQDPLGKTAYYDPEQMSVTLYINGRHPKDVMRSLSHELVHHMQNCNGQFDNTGDMGEGYAQSDPHLREMEREAYEIGNLCLRDWTDTRSGTIYNVSLQEGAKKKMSLKDWKNKELRTVLSERWGFSFNLLNESQEEAVEEGMCQQCMPNPCACGAMEEGEEIEEGAASSGRVVTPDRGGEDRRAGDERKRPMEEGEKMPDKNKDGIPDYAQDGKGAKDLGKAKNVDDDSKDEDDKEEKSDKDLSKVPPQLRKHVKGKMNEAQIRRIIRKLVKEAMTKKAK